MRHVFTTITFVLIAITANAKTIKPDLIADTTNVTNDNVDYKVSQDQSSVYINISTTDTNTMMSMLHMGVSVFFDIKGKKKQNVYVKYPLEPIRPNNKRDNEKSLEEVETVEEMANKRHLRIKNIIENELSQEGEYSYFDVNEEFHILLNTVGVSLAYTYNEEEGLLEYNLMIPKNRISDDSKIDFKKLMIGVKTNQPEKKSENERPSISMGGRGSGRQGGPSGGGGGRQGGGGGQRGGGQKGGSSQKTQNEKPKIETLDFWFDAAL